MVSKKVSVSVSKTFDLEKSLGIGLEKIWSRKKVSVSVSKILVSKKVSVTTLKNLFSKTLDFKNFGPGNGFIEFGLPTSPNMPNMPNNEQHV